MALSEKSEIIGKAFGWGVVVFSAIFAADLSASELDRHLQNAPDPVEVAPASARAAANNSADLANLLNASANSASATASSGAASSSNADKSNTAPSDAKGLEGAELQGTMVTGGYNAAILDMNGTAQVVTEGSTLGDYFLEQVSATWVYFAPVSGKGQGVRLVLATVVESDESQDKPVLASKNNESDKDKEKGDDEVKEQLSLDDIRAALNDTSKISSQVRVVPISKDDQPYGTRLIFRKPNNVMARLGLKNNDVLLSVNGNPARTVEDMYQGYMTIRNAKDLEFVVDRGGNKETVRYELASK